MATGASVVTTARTVGTRRERGRGSTPPGNIRNAAARGSSRGPSLKSTTSNRPSSRRAPGVMTAAEPYCGPFPKATRNAAIAIVSPPAGGRWRGRARASCRPRNPSRTAGRSRSPGARRQGRPLPAGSGSRELSRDLLEDAEGVLHHVLGREPLEIAPAARLAHGSATALVAEHIGEGGGEGGGGPPGGA